MPGWTFDESRFIEEVLAPIKVGWDPADDLFRTHLLPETTSDVPIIEAALAGVGRELRKPAYERWSGPASRLRAVQAVAREVLTSESARKAHLVEVRSRRALLQSSLENRLAGAPGLPEAVVSSIASESRGAHTVVEIRLVLGELGAALRNPVPLPDGPPYQQAGHLRSLLGSIGQSSLWDYLTSHTELTGLATTKTELEKRKDKYRVKMNAETAAEDSVQALLTPLVGSPNGLRDVLRLELITELTDAAQYPFPAVLNAAEKAKDRLVPLGLPDRPEVVAYAVWCRRRHAGTGDGWRTALREALAAKDLRGAVAALDTVPKLSKVERDQREHLAARISKLEQELVGAGQLEKTDVEAAAAAYLKVGTELAAPAVGAGLARCVPAPPTRLNTRITGEQVSLSWERSAARAGRVTYTVVRAVGHAPADPQDGTVLLADTTQTLATDNRPPSAQPLNYAVFTVREGAVSRPVTTPPVLVLGEVSGLVVEPACDAVAASWTLPQGASGALVSRTPVSGVAATELRGVSPQSFTDRDVRVGERYAYLVRARFPLLDGSTVTSAGVRVEGECQEVPVAVPNLNVRLDGDELDLSWRPPPRGDVQIREVSGNAPRPGLVSVSSLGDLGRPLDGVTLRRRDGWRARPASGTGRMVMVAVTVLGDLAAVGAVAEVDRKLRPVKDLKAVRRSGEVTLTWIWPDGVNEVRVAGSQRRPSSPTDSSLLWRQVSRASYEAVGVHLSLPEHHSTLAVCTVSTEGGRMVFGPLSHVTAEGVQEIPYQVERARWKRRRVTVGTLRGPVLPVTVLVARSRLRAMNREDGVEVLRFEGGPSQVVKEFKEAELSRLGKPVHLRLFSLEPTAVAVPTRPDQLIIT